MSGLAPSLAHHDQATSPSQLSRVHVTVDDSPDIAALARRYLSPVEQPAFAARSARGVVPWLLGRVAAKDAVRRHLVARGFAEIDPTRIVVVNDSSGRPAVEVRGARPRPAACASRSPTSRPWRSPWPPRCRGRLAPGQIDVRRRPGSEWTSRRSRPGHPRSRSTAFTPGERTLARGRGEERDSWLTRLWAVKEATAKATGLGLGGRPKDFEIEAVRDDRLRCRGRWVATESLRTMRGDFIVAWTDID